MIGYPSEIRFKFSWRSYQARVLSELEEHLDDNRLHVVAAPGSGKTVLGLEVIRRLNRPTLILSPTITIRNQWIDRFVNLFLPDGSKKPDWITTDIRNPKFLTVTTYQALHSVYSGIIDTEERDEGFDEELNELSLEEDEKIDIKDKNKINIIEVLQEIGIKTIVVDEAHHLRTEWWKSLIAVIDKLGKVRVVSLTATPPLDVSPVEWRKYIELCGPIDAEITVPELVLKNNLCPHQDYVYLSLPSKEEGRRIQDFRNNVELFFKDLIKNQEFVSALIEHSWIKSPEDHVERILSSPDYFSSIAIFFNHIGSEVPENFFKVMGISRKRIPKLTFEWMEILLTGCIYNDRDNFIQFEDTIKEIQRYLSRIGAIERKKVYLQKTKRINKILASSITKLDSIISIVKLESSALKSDLRMVILTDFIRKSELPKEPSDIKPLNRIGVVPIFEKLRRQNLHDIKLGILSGTLVVIPKSSLEQFRDILGKSDIDEEKLKIKPLECDLNYCLVDIQGQDKQKIVRLITKLFSDGGITVLVGTKSLLGEGWDAPSINTLILASFVGSYMLSNQMRGRAIRTQPDNPDKTANIWHLVCIEQRKPEDFNKMLGLSYYPELAELYRKDAGEDFDMLKRRFKAFVGVSFKEPIIENGINRLNLGESTYDRDKIYKINIEMGNKSLSRNALRKLWDEALQRGKEGMRVVEEISADSLTFPTHLIYNKTIKAVLLEGVSAICAIFLIFLGSPYAILFLITSIGALPGFFKAIWSYFKYGSVASCIRQIAEALLKSLAFYNIIKTDITKLGTVAEIDKKGIVTCSMKGGTAYEKSLFLNSLEEILDPIENPRYLIIRKSWFGIIERNEYYNVPQVLARKKKYAEYFSKMWKKYVGPTKLIYTRTMEGRKILLKARANSFSTSIQKKAERRSCWK